MHRIRNLGHPRPPSRRLAARKFGTREVGVGQAHPSAQHVKHRPAPLTQELPESPVVELLRVDERLLQLVALTSAK
jgi:hypothetical protein